MEKGLIDTRQTVRNTKPINRTNCPRISLAVIRDVLSPLGRVFYLTTIEMSMQIDQQSDRGGRSTLVLKGAAVCDVGELKK